MSVTGYVIEKYNNMDKAYTCNRLAEEARLQGIDLKIIGIHDTIISSNGIRNGGFELEKRDFAINRYKWGKEKDAINSLVARSYNALAEYNLYINKYEQIKRLRSEHFLIPKYILGTALSSYETVTAELGIPFVAKGLESSMGEEVFLIEKKADMDKLGHEYGISKEWLFEEFITTSYGQDIRFFSIRGDAAACMLRKSKDDFRANVALGASVEPYEITPKIRQIAKDIYEQTKLDFVGIDLMFGTAKPYFCEINVMPGIEGIEKATGVNVARKIMETVKEDFDDE